MLVNEHFPPSSVAPKADCSSDYDSRRFLAANLGLLETFYFNFYETFCRPEAQTGFDTVLSFGELQRSIIIARHNDDQPIDDAESYLIKQYDLTTGKTLDWNPVFTPGSGNGISGQGDDLVFRMVLEDASDSHYTAVLTLSSSGNHWRSNDEEGELKSALLLPYQAIYDARQRDMDLYQKIHENERRIAALTKRALTNR